MYIILETSTDTWSSA